jgi:hypothetical protein
LVAPVIPTPGIPALLYSFDQSNASHDAVGFNQYIGAHYQDTKEYVVSAPVVCFYVTGKILFPFVLGFDGGIAHGDDA